VLPLVKQITDLIYQTPQGADWMATCEDAADRIVGLLNARDYEESVSGAFDPRSGLKGDGWHNARAEALIDPNDPAARERDPARGERPARPRRVVSDRRRRARRPSGCHMTPTRRVSCAVALIAITAGFAIAAYLVVGWLA
jgi:hypothetical protein